MPKVIPFGWDTGRTPVFQVQVEQNYGTFSVHAMVWQHDPATEQLQAPPFQLEKFCVHTHEYRPNDVPANEFGRFFNWRASYRQPYEVDIETARIMLATLTALERGLNAYTKELGPSNSYAQFLVRVARLLGIGRYVTKRSAQQTYNLIEITSVDTSLLYAVRERYPEALYV